MSKIKVRAPVVELDEVREPQRRIPDDDDDPRGDPLRTPRGRTEDRGVEIGREPRIRRRLDALQQRHIRRLRQTRTRDPQPHPWTLRRRSCGGAGAAGPPNPPPCASAL